MNVEKRKAEAARTKSNIQNEKDRVLIDAAKNADEAEAKHAKVVVDAVKAKRDSQREVMTNQHDANRDY